MTGRVAASLEKTFWADSNKPANFSHFGFLPAYACASPDLEWAKFLKL